MQKPIANRIAQANMLLEFAAGMAVERNGNHSGNLPVGLILTTEPIDGSVIAACAAITHKSYILFGDRIPNIPCIIQQIGNNVASACLIETLRTIAPSSFMILKIDQRNGLDAGAYAKMIDREVFDAFKKDGERDIEIMFEPGLLL